MGGIKLEYFTCVNCGKKVKLIVRSYHNWCAECYANR